MQLEISWIISNITYSNEHDIFYMYQDKFGLINFLNQVLISNDLQLID